MKVVLSVRESPEKNAARYFEEAKKAKKKLEGAKKALAQTRAKLEALERAERKAQASKPQPKEKRKKAWYEKFHWCFSSEGFLVIAGRDATSNEILVKKHAEAGDLVFHTDMSGSPFALVKGEGREVPQPTKEEAAQLVACYSKAWKLNMPGLEVFYVAPEQVSKTPNAGEFLAKGAFVIRGKTTYLHPALEFAVGPYNGAVMGGPPSAVRAHCEKSVLVVPGDAKTSDAAKLIQKAIGGDLDEIVAVLPAGGCAVKPQKAPTPQRPGP